MTGRVQQAGRLGSAAKPIPNYAIVGNAGVGGATITPSGGLTVITADASGDYAVVVPQGWGGTITPSKTYYEFTPASKNYSGVVTNDYDEDYTAALWYQAIIDWQDAQTTYIRAGGLAVADWVNSAGISGSTTGRTWIDRHTNHRIRQHGEIEKIKIYVNKIGHSGKTFKFKLFRPNGNNLDFVADSESIDLPFGGTGEQEVTLSTPLACQPGDILGFWSEADATADNRFAVGGKLAGESWYISGEVTDDVAISSLTEYPYGLCLDAFILAPYLLITGDSIAKGNNVGSALVDKWRSIYDDGPEGNIDAQIQQRLRILTGDSPILKYQNFARGSMGWEWVKDTGLVDGLEVKPNTVLIHCGVNDTGLPWSSIEPYLDDVKILIDAADPVPTLLIDELLPATMLGDAAAGRVRTFNTELATWCTANGATLIPCWATFGILRESTGYNDDILPAYTYDGLHLSLAGEDVLAAIWKEYV